MLLYSNTGGGKNGVATCPLPTCPAALLSAFESKATATVVSCQPDAQNLCMKLSGSRL